MTLDFSNETDFTADSVYISEIRRAAELALEMEGINFASEASLVFVDNRKIQELNKKYRQIDAVTDVLSFPAHNLTPGDYAALKSVPPPVNFGDIVISIEKASSQAKEYGHSLMRELAFLTVHSILHLLGYDHLNVNDEKKMTEMQEHILANAGILR